MILKSPLAAMAAAVIFTFAALGTNIATAEPSAPPKPLHIQAPEIGFPWTAKWIAAPLGPHNPLKELSWVWGDNGGGLARPTRTWFRRQIHLPANAIIRTAVFELTADENFALFINGVRASASTQWRGANWNAIYHPNVSQYLHGGVNTLAIAASNAGDNVNDAGLIGSLAITLRSGKQITVPIDKNWMTTQRPPPAGWIAPHFLEAGWTPAQTIAHWGRGPWGHRPHPRQALPLFRHSFTATKPVAGATIKIAGLGQYILFINGHKISSTTMQPAWSNYQKTVWYNRYNVAPLLRQGRNTVGVMLGTGMYDCPEATRRYDHAPNPFGRPELILQLHIRFNDGTTENIISNNRWRTAPGPVTFSSIYGGEDYNAQGESPGWSEPVFNDTQWRRVIVTHGPGGTLRPQLAPPVKVMHVYKAVRITHPRSGVIVYDLGQNMAGRPVITARGPAGATFTVYPSELLHPNGTEWQSCAAPIWCTYTLKGKGVETFHPVFSYFGFRYVQIDGATTDADNPGKKPVILNVVGQATHTSSPTIGHFSCSNKLLNEIHQLITMAMVNNMVSIITDCPTREKTGWLEDTYLVGPGIMDNDGVRKLYEQTAANMRDAQRPDGMVPDFAPEYFNYPGAFTDSPEWGSACVLDPWLTYQYFGDKQILAENYQMMNRYMRYLKSKAHHNLLVYGLGDWYDLGPGPPGGEQLTTLGVTATATWYRDLVVMAQISRIMHHPNIATKYNHQAHRVRIAFNQAFYHSATGQYDRGSQCANAMALATGLATRADRAKVLDNLIADIRRHGYHTTAGDIGFHYVVRALEDADQSQLLYKMATQTNPPSYGYQIAHGATALTEAWNSDAGSSQDHFMLGHIEEWFYRGLGGIYLDMAKAPGHQLQIRPAIVKGLQWVHVTYDSVLGKIVSRWRRSANRLILQVTIPPGTPAEVYVPTADSSTIRVNHKTLSQLGISADRVGQDTFALRLTSGHYRCTFVGK